jgi:dihydroxyacid dehydratase/phosphogluconate dehydratase
MVLSGTVEEGDRVTVDAADGELSFEVEHGAAKESLAREPAGAAGNR